MKRYDLIVIGAGAAGLIASIFAKRDNKEVLLLEKMPQIALKLKASGGGRCNLTNTLDTQSFIEAFGKNKAFIKFTLELFSQSELIDFFNSIGLQTHAPDGFRVFPTSHNSQTVLNALIAEIKRLNIKTICSCKVNDIVVKNSEIKAVKSSCGEFECKNIILATGGLGYSQLGSSGDGYKMAKKLGINVTKLYPAMMPLKVKESWVAKCRADTVAKARIEVAIKKYKHLKSVGDLIFTKDGIRGPVVLDFSREITPLLDKFNEVPIILNLVKGLNENQILEHFKKLISKNPTIKTIDLVNSLLAKSIALEICKISNIKPHLTFKKQKGTSRDLLIKNLAKTPLTVTGHDGFKKAMVTRGGIDLKEIDPYTMSSKKIKGLYFAGEIINIDGPCGGYNLQYCFSSGYLASRLW